MKMISEGYRGISFFVEVNFDRLLAPVMIVSALTLAGWVVSLL